jgi:CRP-like cAMP-binding protein
MSTPLQTFMVATLGQLPAQALAAVASSRAREASVGDALLRAGDRWSSLYWVESGVLRLFYLDRRGHSANKNFFVDGAMLWPLTPALAGQAVDFWIEAIAPTRVWALSWPAWQLACADWTAWQAVERRTLAVLLDDKMRREQLFLQCTATQRYQDLCTLRPDWLARIPLRHLASYLGITDVALSRIRRRLNPGSCAKR